MLLLNQMGSKLAMRSGIGFKTCYALRNWVQNLICAQELGSKLAMRSGNESRLDNIR